MRHPIGYLRTFAALALAGGLAGGLSACGGSGGGVAITTVSLSALTSGYAVASGTVEVPAGETRVHGDIAFTCPSGGGACTVEITVGTDGTATATSRGGMATAMDSADYTARIQLRAEKLDDAIIADPATAFPALLETDGSGAPTDDSMLVSVANAARAAIAGWDDAVYQRLNEESLIAGTPESIDSVVLYSNKEEPTPTPFAAVHPLDNDADGDSTNDSVALVTTNVGLVGNVPGFPSAVNQTAVPFADDSTHAGTFAGAPGTYTCVMNCTLSTDENGDLDAVAGTWYFTPTDEEYLIPVPDADYIHFGYWMNEADVSGQPAFMVAPVAGGTEASAIATVRSLEGSATYDGAATGLFVRRVLTPEGDVGSRSTGQFSADATLTASFGGGAVPANDHYSIQGTIGRFVDGGGATIDASWSVELQRSAFGTAGDVDGNVFSGRTEGDAGLMGDWNGRFFGPVMLDADTVTQGNQSTLPSAVAGTFDAHFTNGAVIGAFGAENAD